MGETEEIPEEAKKRVKDWAATQPDPGLSEEFEIHRLQQEHSGREADPVPGEQRHFSGREGVPGLQDVPSSRGFKRPRLRDRVDPKDPETQPGPLKIRKLPNK